MIKPHYPRIHNSGLIGSCFLLAFVAYGLGRYLFDSENLTTRIAGSSLIMTNSLVVFLIGYLMKKNLVKYHLQVAGLYLATRILEGIVLSTIVINWLIGGSMSEDIGYYIAMIILGLGSLPLCAVFLKHNIIPRYLAIWGLIGYAIFALGFILELLGLSWSMVLLIPGGLWEITFAAWLIMRGNSSLA